MTIFRPHSLGLFMKSKHIQSWAQQGLTMCFVQLTVPFIFRSFPLNLDSPAPDPLEEPGGQSGHQAERRPGRQRPAAVPLPGLVERPGGPGRDRPPLEEPPQVVGEVLGRDGASSGPC